MPRVARGPGGGPSSPSGITSVQAPERASLRSLVALLQTRWLDFAKLAVFYGVLSILYSLTTWARVEPSAAGFPSLTLRLAVDIPLHPLIGGLAAIPSRRADVVVGSALVASAIDADHLLYYLGLPIAGRASHSVGFLAGSGAVFYLLAMTRAGRMGWSPMMAAAIASCGVLTHLAVDSLFARSFAPLLLPFTGDPVQLTRPFAFICFTAAAVILSLAAQRTAEDRAVIPSRRE